MTRDKPFRLYKYQSYNIQTIDNLLKQQLWFSNPLKFNDPFDCYIPAKCLCKNNFRFLNERAEKRVES